MKPSNKWLNKILPTYKEAVNHFDYFSYYEFESYGKGKSNIAPNNGCARGKYLMDMHVQMYREGINDQVFTKDELINTLPNILSIKHYDYC